LVNFILAIIKSDILFGAAVIFGVLSLIYIGIPFYLIIWIYSMFDAYTQAQEISKS
jgi:hypothetical protein